jgi:hypothetical protein
MAGAAGAGSAGPAGLDHLLADGLARGAGKTARPAVQLSAAEEPWAVPGSAG